MTERSDPEVAELASSIAVTAARLTRALRHQTSMGLTLSQLSVLATVEAEAPISLSRLARLEQVSPPTLTRVVRALVDNGLLVRRQDPADRRSAVLLLTPVGRESLTSVRTARVALVADRLDGMSERDRAALARGVALLADLARGIG